MWREGLQTRRQQARPLAGSSGDTTWDGGSIEWRCFDPRSPSSAIHKPKFVRHAAGVPTGPLAPSG